MHDVGDIDMSSMLRYGAFCTEKNILQQFSLFLFNQTAFTRPTLEQLMEGQKMEKQEDQEEDGEAMEGKVTKTFSMIL